jgi:uncharacterized protein YjiS (DUF1127 family)
MSHLVAIGSARRGSVCDATNRLSAVARGLLATIGAAIGAWAARRRQARALADLAEYDDYLLADIGLTRDEARREAAKPLWTFYSLSKTRGLG